MSLSDWDLKFRKQIHKLGQQEHQKTIESERATSLAIWKEDHPGQEPDLKTLAKLNNISDKFVNQTPIEIEYCGFKAKYFPIHDTVRVLNEVTGSWE